jgi:hypothetical protein
MNRKILTAITIACLAFSNASPAELTPEQANQIDEGRKVFMEETFDGNGRSCGTCHIPSEGYNIFPASIKKLKKKERELVFASNVPGFENEELIRTFALFNISGGPAPLCPGDDPVCFDDDDGHHGPVFRASMAIQALDLTTQLAVDIEDGEVVPNPDFPGTPLLPPECSEGVELELPQLGWSGDGSPGTPKQLPGDDTCQTHHGEFDADADGSFRAFATGAIAQHFTKSLDRIVGVDFRRGTAEELDAMEAFQRWLGRRPLNEEENTIQGTENATEFDIKLLDFKDPRVALGRDHYALTEGAACDRCHDNGGALSNDSGGNDNAITSVNMAEDDIGLATVGFPLPEDDGAIVNAFAGGDSGEIFGAFNTQSLIEAAEKKAWFHNHRVVDDFEEAIAHYGTLDFLVGDPDKNPRGRPIPSVKPGGFTPGSRLFTPERSMAALHFGRRVDADGNPLPPDTFPAGDGVEHLGAFLRALNAFYNLRDCERLLGEAMDRLDLNVSAENPLQHCMLNLEAVTRVLDESKLPSLYKHVQKDAKKAEKKLKGIMKEAEAAIGKKKVDARKIAKVQGKLADMNFEIADLRDSIATQMAPL